MTARGRWAMPDAVTVLRADAPRERWLDERRKGLGGSDASTVAGVNRWSSRYELWLDKTGRLEAEAPNARMRAGQRIEPILRTWFTEDRGIAVRRHGLVRSKARPWQQVSLDGLTEDGGIFEAKTLGWRVREEWDDDQVADHAEVQVQHGLAVTGRSHAWVVALIDGWDFQVRRVERDEKLIDLVTSMEDEFWQRHVVADEPPAIEANDLDAVKNRWRDADDGEPAVCSPGEWEPLRDAYRTAAAAVKDAQMRKDAAEAAIRDLLGPATELIVAGERAATCRPVTAARLDAKRLRADRPDLAEQYTSESTYRRLTIPKEK